MAEQSIRPDDLALVVRVSEIEEEKDESAKMMESNIYPRKLVEHLNKQRNNKKYCDFTIHVGDQDFPVHQNILAARSEYFDVMFTSKMKESFEKQVAMKDISEDCMKWILDFLYSGKIKFTLKNIKEIIQSAALMQIQELLDLATEYVVQVLSPQNCFLFFQIGKLHLLNDLANAAKKYLLSHFGKVARQDWFVDLDFQDLETFLSSQDVVVINEKKVYEALMRWLKHDLDSRKEYFPTLFQHIRLSALPLKYIEDVIRKEININCASSILSSCIHLNNGYVCDRSTLYWCDGKTLGTFAQLPTNFQCQYMVYIGKSKPRTGATYQIYKFSIKSKQFNEVVTCYTPWRTGASVVAVGDKMYIMGGYLYRYGSSDIKTASDLVDILNLNEDDFQWKIAQNLKIPRAYFAAAQLRSRIYSFGGFGKNNERLTSGEFMDLSDGVWNKLTNDVPLPLGSASAFCVGDHIAVHGNDETLKKIFLFNSFNEEWVVLENVKKVKHFMVEEVDF